MRSKSTKRQYWRMGQKSAQKAPSAELRGSRAMQKIAILSHQLQVSSRSPRSMDLLFLLGGTSKPYVCCLMTCTMSLGGQLVH